MGKSLGSKAARRAWLDREGRARPTPERLSKGDFHLRDTDDAGVTYAVDVRSTILDDLAERGVITQDQCKGGHDFASLMRRTRLVSEGRSCLDFTPVGYDGDHDEDDLQEILDNQDRAELYLACGMFTWAELRRVCVEQCRPTDIDRLRSGLDLCVAFWK